jgi:hypothetical protein
MFLLILSPVIQSSLALPKFSLVVIKCAKFVVSTPVMIFHKVLRGYI